MIVDSISQLADFVQPTDNALVKPLFPELTSESQDFDPRSRQVADQARPIDLDPRMERLGGRAQLRGPRGNDQGVTDFVLAKQPAQRHRSRQAPRPHRQAARRTFDLARQATRIRQSSSQAAPGKAESVAPTFERNPFDEDARPA